MVASSGMMVTLFFGGWTLPFWDWITRPRRWRAASRTSWFSWSK